MTARLALALGLSLFGMSRLVAEDWPQFLGPRRDGTTSDEALVSAWRRGPLRVLWRAPIGVGYSGLAVVGERLYGMDRVQG
ncbi:MAG TPA: pyrrolo-quinoline quinone, partial [Vicinamibacteria bacterium]